MFTFRLIVTTLPIVMLVLSAAGAFGQATSTGSGQDYPNRPIRIVTSTMGGGSDFAARLIAPGISVPLGQSVIIDNRPPVAAVETVVKAPPDGYSLLVTGSQLWTGPLLRTLSYDAVRDVAPISVVARSINVLVVHPAVPVNSVKELIALAKAKPGAFNYSSGGTGGTGHLTGELFKAAAGVNIVHVPYKGGAAAINDLLAGQVQMTFDDPSTVMQHVKAGRLRALAVTSAEPSELVPGLPTVAASLPGFEATQITGIFAPSKTPGAIIDRLNQEVVRFINRAEVRERLLSNGSEASTSSPEQFATTIKSETAKWGKVIKDTGIKVD